MSLLPHSPKQPPSCRKYRAAHQGAQHDEAQSQHCRAGDQLHGSEAYNAKLVGDISNVEGDNPECHQKRYDDDDRIGDPTATVLAGRPYAVAVVLRQF